LKGRDQNSRKARYPTKQFLVWGYRKKHQLNRVKNPGRRTGSKWGHNRDRGIQNARGVGNHELKFENPRGASFGKPEKGQSSKDKEST